MVGSQSDQRIDQFSSERRGRPRLGNREVAKGRDHYLYYNGHGDLAVEADTSGTRTALHTYDPFGAPLDTPPANSTVHRFTGAWDKQLDTTSSLVLMGARPYDPSLGRFLAVDPVDGGSLNNYDYAGQDPINGFDLDGNCWTGLCWAKHAAQAVILGALKTSGDVMDAIVKISDKAAEHLPAWIRNADQGIGDSVLRISPAALAIVITAINAARDVKHGDAPWTAAAREALKTLGAMAGADVAVGRCVSAFGADWGAVGCALLTVPGSAYAGERLGAIAGNDILGRRGR